MATFNIAIIGECMIELQEKDAQLNRTFGGDTLNTAVYLSRLTKDKDINTTYITALGTDNFSDEMMTAWNAEGIDTSKILRLENKHPGLYYIETDETGERSFHYWRNDAAAKYLLEQPESEALLAGLMDFDAIYLSGISLAILTEASREQLFSFLEAFSAKGGKVLFDNNYRPKLWEKKEDAQAAYLRILSMTDIALLTFDDEQLLYGDETVEDCIARTQAAGVEEIAIKRGKEACLVVEQDEHTFVPALVAKAVVDTTAAGDSFSGGYLAKRFTGGSAIQAAHAGHQVASTVIQYRGAVIPADVIPNIFA
ncbi:sugar kinase [Photobacterium sanctipauli]|uniref:2-dehydro-3-deoxygluconokinase n=1 Tax=Photobacterium sanctipauli TaxID=1342794 RepID=A0A2T3NW74_9GAMM|nr:sugar kinase [Photobacterium sanctipauli]PSW20505.1 sugar kinase [Photobacterium sanctipauli]